MYNISWCEVCKEPHGTVTDYCSVYCRCEREAQDFQRELFKLSIPKE